MKFLILLCLGLTSFSYAQDNIQVNLGVRKSPQRSIYDKSASASYLMSVNKDGSLKIGPRVETLFDTSKYGKRMSLEYLDEQNIGATRSPVYTNYLKSSYLELTVGPQIEKSLSIGEYDGIVTIGGSVGAGLYKFKDKTISATATPHINNNIPGVVVEVEEIEHNSVTNGGIIAYSLAGGLNISELINPNRETQNNVYLTSGIGANHRKSGKEFSSTSLTASVGIKGTIGTERKNVKVVEY